MHYGNKIIILDNDQRLTLTMLLRLRRRRTETLLAFRSDKEFRRAAQGFLRSTRVD